MMKITFLINSLDSGGAERTVTYLSKEFAKLGHDITVMIYSNKLFYRLDDHVKFINIDPQESKNHIFRRLKNVIHRRRAITKYLKETPQDAVFCMLYPSIFYMLFRKKVAVISSERSAPIYLKNIIKRMIRRFFFKRTDGMVFQTERARDYYPKSITTKSIVIPNAVGNNYIERINQENDRVIEKRIVAIGSLKVEKDYETLIKAFSIVHKNHPDYILELYGEGPLRSKLTDLIKALDLENNVVLMGKHEDALYKVKNAACFVMSSISEGMPNALMEAMAIGLPCISTDCENGPRELINDGHNGLLVPVQDQKAMSAAICRFIENQEFAETCGKNAKEILKTNSLERIATRFLDYIEEVVNKKRK